MCVWSLVEAIQTLFSSAGNVRNEDIARSSAGRLLTSCLECHEADDFSFTMNEQCDSLHSSSATRVTCHIGVAETSSVEVA